MPACLRSVDSPDFDLLILQDGESHPEYVSGAYEFSDWVVVCLLKKPRIALTVRMI